MNHSELFFLGLDVDDKKFHGFALSILSGESFDFCCEPNQKALEKQLAQRKIHPKNLKICYEATYLGFSLCRSLREAGFHCDVIAPSLIPQVKGDKVKTDRLDAEKLARYYASSLLTVVHVPDLEQEMERDILRSRKFIVDQMSATKKHINSLTRRLGWSYKSEEGAKKSWTNSYIYWLKAKVRSSDSSALKLNLEILLRQYESCAERVLEYDHQIDKLAQSDLYREKVRALSTYRGIDQQTALVLVTELGDIKRFAHPKQLASYAGLDMIERSSGGCEKKFGISKDGNRFIRTAVVESCQTASLPVKVSRSLTLRRLDVEARYIDIADRCMGRLNKKSRRLLARGKQRNKVKVACAREMLGFIWETLRAADTI